jgi:hypothetical protein
MSKSELKRHGHWPCIFASEYKAVFLDNSVSYELESITAVNCRILHFFICSFDSVMLLTETFERCSLLYIMGQIVFIHYYVPFSFTLLLKMVLGSLSVAVKRLGHSRSFTDI